MVASPSLLLPAAVLRFWDDRQREERQHEERQKLLKEATTGESGIHWVHDHLCVIFPAAGDPGIFDLAVDLAATLVEPSESRGPGEKAPRVLIFPGQVRVNEEGCQLLPDPILEDVESVPPALVPGRIHLSTYAAARMERRHSVRSAGFYLSPRGLKIPLVQTQGDDLSSPPYRNFEVLRRRPAYVRRPEIDSPLSAPTRWLLVTGAAGNGKSRAVFEALAPGEKTVLWVHVPPARRSRFSFAELLCRRLETVASTLGVKLPTLEGRLNNPDEEQLEALAQAIPGWLVELGTAIGSTPTVVVDDLEVATTPTLRQLEPLLECARESARIRLVAIGRPGSPWPRGWPLPPRVEVGAIPGGALERLLSPLASALSMPTSVQQQVLDLAGGNPFALEEELSALVHQRQIRQVYGSFFWSGGALEKLRPSARWIAHVEAETLRIGSPMASRLLAISETPLPVAVLSEAAADLGEVMDSQWHLSPSVSGWLEPRSSTWGQGVTLACPAVAAALASSLPEAATLAMRQSLGRVLPTEEERSAWQRYRLLATAPEALPFLIEALEKQQAPAEEALAALTTELAGLRQRRPNEHLELLTLWHLLPLARRLGKLRHYQADLARARELAKNEPKRALAFAGLAAEQAEVEGRLAEAESILRETLVGASTQDEQSGALLILRLGRLLLRQERFQESRELLERVLPALRSAGAQALQASCLFYLGNVAIHQRRLNDALDLHQEALALRKRSDRSKSLGASMSALGHLALLCGEYPLALKRYREAEAIFVAAGEKVELSFALLGIGKARSKLGDYAAASTPLRQALAMRVDAEDQAGEALARLAVAENYFYLQRLDEALREARQGLFDLRLLTSLNAATGDAERLMGRILLAKRQVAEANRCFGSAAEAHRRGADPLALVLDQAYWMEAAIAGHSVDRVEHLVSELDQALAKESFLEHRELIELRLFAGLTWLAERQGRPRGALEHLRLAYRALLLKADRLSPAQRHQFLFQVKEHAEIVTAATQEGVDWQGEGFSVPSSPDTVPIEPMV